MRYLTSPEALDLTQLGCAGRRMPVRDAGLLDSALHRPASSMLGVEAYAGLFEKAAVLLQGLAVNHPLVDGNKRMSWMCTVVFLHLHGVRMLDVDQDEAYELVVGVASGALGEPEVIAGRLRSLHAAAEEAA
ncbi:type II toxin-antitoxin system death-on-curing family toxin [Streptomyces sp. NA04227]|uniref:type II toxin-antitoxin system death-on-curing family toxin n=1 Tax=Streptomyces sp. NA04227 TaxID=2742136 RepID=UPI0015900261|nr:type II toxin-antitoxin system death-on-curing family toxin [Streptomyces sp. NA04227]QKW06776.1 type II toxin-antitoxin system death-on-curing family toxin [Streptomyces sp. NA04227]